MLIVFQLSAWRPVAHKGRNQLHFNIQEKISAAIYNRPEETVYKDMCHMHGTISCKVCYSIAFIHLQ